jgi:hypothetical protein
MISSPRHASPFALLIAFALGTALVLSPGCGGGDNPAHFAGSIDLPKREPTRVTAKDFVKGKAGGKVDAH